jgi:D-alanyl-D-alanine carboxypeptidase/D-alanyl-D-alanine-endopeptidase (penicillin-binding protein 4)
MPKGPATLLRTLLLASLLGAPAAASRERALLDPAAVAAQLSQVESHALFKQARPGVVVVDVESGREVYSSGDAPMIPASTAKLLTTATALKTLGPSWRFTTSLVTDGRLKGDGTLEGDLYVVGGGDPTMVVEKLWKLVYDLKLAGVTAVSGDVLFDESYMDSEYAIHGWDKAADIERGPPYYAPIGALSLNFNTEAIVVGPGEAPGDPARVALETPAMKVITVDNRATTGKAGSSPSLQLGREVDGDRVTFVVSGRVPAGSIADRYYKTVSDPTSYFTAAFAEMMKLHGIRVGGSYLEREAPGGVKTLVSLKSPPLSTILMEMNKSSSNFYAEQVFKATGAEFTGGTGTWAAGEAAVSAYLEGLGISEGYTLMNGSGLSADTRVKPSHLTAVLVDMARDEEVGAEFAASLAIGGQDGTLRKRMTDEDEQGRIRGKTGTLSGVSALAGYVNAGDGRRYAFAFLANGLSGGSAQAKSAQDLLVQLLLDLPAPDMADPSIEVAEQAP